MFYYYELNNNPPTNTSLPAPRELGKLRILRLGGNEQWSEHEDSGRQQLDHDVKRRPRRVLEGVPDGVACDGRLVRVAALSSEVPQLSEPERSATNQCGGVVVKAFDAVNTEDNKSIGPRMMLARVKTYTRMLSFKAHQAKRGHR